MLRIAIDEKAIRVVGRRRDVVLSIGMGYALLSCAICNFSLVVACHEECLFI
jgi:hypothetical protein